MTSDKELDDLIAQAERRGAVVTVERDADGGYRSVMVAGLPGCGPRPMSPISAAERLRELVGQHVN